MVSVKHVPDGYHTITPYLMVPDVSVLVDFLKRAFNAKQFDWNVGPDGTVAHASVRIGDSMLMMGAARGSWKAEPITLYMYVQEVDYVYQTALAAGAESVQEPRHEFYGDRTAAIKDPAGNRWYIATRVEEIHPEELQRRFLAARAKQS
jgi:PhnB protein